MAEEIKDWESKEELREDLEAKDPRVALALAEAMTANLDELPEAYVTGLPAGGKFVVAIAISQEDYDAIPDPSIYENYLFAITEE